MQNESYLSQIKPLISGVINLIPVLFLGAVVILTGIWITAESFTFWHLSVGYGFYHALITASASELLSLAAIGYWKPAGPWGKTFRGFMILAAFCFIVIPASFKSVESFSGKLHLQPMDQAKYVTLAAKVERLQKDKQHYAGQVEKTGKWQPAFNRVERELRDAEAEVAAFLASVQVDQAQVRQEKILVWTCFGIRGFVQLLNWIMFHVLVAGYLFPVLKRFNQLSNAFEAFESNYSNLSTNFQMLSSQEVIPKIAYAFDGPFDDSGSNGQIPDSRESNVVNLIKRRGGSASFRQIRESKKLDTADECRMILGRLVNRGEVSLLNPADSPWDHIFAIQSRLRRVK